MVTPAYRQDEEEGVGRRTAPASPEGEANWRHSRSFLAKMACLTEEAAALDTRSAAAHRKYTITGFQDSEDGLQAMVRVKVANGGETLLSLEPEILGRVVGLPFEGLEVPDALSSEDKEQVVVPKGKRKTNGAYYLNSIDHPGLRDYIEGRQGEVLSQPKHGVSLVELFCFQEQFFRNGQYNWAEKRIKNARRQLRGRKPLSIPVQDLLASYFDCALPAVLSFKIAAKRLEKLQAGSGRRKKHHNDVRKGLRKGLEEEFEKQRTDYGSGRQPEEVETLRRSKRLREHAKEDPMKSDHWDHTGANETSKERDSSIWENAAARRPADAYDGSPQLRVKYEIALTVLDAFAGALRVVDRALRP